MPFVKDRISSIKQHLTVDDKNSELLDALLEIPDDIEESVINPFISALRFSGQDHVANIFRRESDDICMSDEHYEKLSTKRCDICKFMNPEDGLIGYLISVKIFSERDKEKILSKTTLDHMAEETVNILLRKSDGAFDEFVRALNETNQSHVSYILTDDGNPPMSKEHRSILRRNMNDLKKFTDTENGLLDQLLSRDIISLHDSGQIRSVKDQNAMAKKLIEILLRKSDDAFHQFITSLRETRQNHVAYILTGDDNSRPLKEEHRAKLLSSPRDELVKTIASKNSGLISALMSNDVFSSDDEQRVVSVQPGTDDDRNEMILNLIARKSQSDFFKFITALIDTEQTHVVFLLIGSYLNAKIETVYQHGARMSDVDREVVQYMQEMLQSDDDQRVRRLTDVLSENGIEVLAIRQGCIEITFACKNVESLRNFHDLYESGKLQDMLNEIFSPQFAEKGLKSLKVDISKGKFDQCAQMFARCIPMTSEHRETLLTLSSRKRLVNQMTVSDELLDKLSLCKRRRKAIESAASHEQVKTLLDVISRQADSAFSQLLIALNDTQQTKAADIISSQSKTATKSEAGKLHKRHHYSY